MPLRPCPLVAVLTAVLVAGCSLPGDSGAAPDRAAWTEAHDRWQATEPDRYSYRVDLSCECVGVLSYYVSVDGGRVDSTAALDYDGRPLAPGTVFEGETIPGDLDPPTIPELFDLLDRAIRDGNEIQARYDPSYGFPTSAQPDVVEAAVDGSTGYGVYDFQAL